MVEQYKTIASSSEGFFKDRGSRFISRLYYVETEVEVKAIQESLRKEFYDARHHCFAYRIDPVDEKFRSSDDGEPSGTAGKPILNQIYSAELFNVLLVVVRYFGGTKLGVSGLINAYKLAARDAIMQSKIFTHFLTREVELHFEYPLMNVVMRMVKEEQYKILHQGFVTHSVIKIEVKLGDYKNLLLRCSKIRGLTLKTLKDS